MCQESLIEYLTTKLNIQKVDLSASKTEQKEMFADSKPKQLGITVEENKNNISRTDLEKFIKYKQPNDWIKKHTKHINDALDTVKICDPAIGSGAFPVGLLMEIYTAKQALQEISGIDINKENNAADLKEHIIQNSIYGVDIEKGAVDIARLRFWLSLIIDETEPKALPNLDYKIVVGNSLVPMFENEVLEIDWSNDTSKQGHFGQEKANEINKLLEKITDKQKKFFDPKTVNKTNVKQDIENLKADLLIMQLDLMIKTRGLDVEPKANDFKNKKKSEYIKAHDLWSETENWQKSIKKLERIKLNPDKPLKYFDWNLDFAEILNNKIAIKEGFDIVIGNPPYLGEKGQKEMFRVIKKCSLGSFYKSKMDLFYFFFHQSINLSKNNGSICFITTNYYITADSALNLRTDFKVRTKPTSFINFNEFKIFDSALGQHNMITFLNKNSNNKNKTKITDCNRKNQTGSLLLENILSGTDNKTRYYEVNNVFEGENNYIRLSKSEGNINDILHKIKSEGKDLESLFNINAGCDITISKIKPKHIAQFKISAERNEGVFVLSKSELENLTLNNYEKSLIKDFIKNSDIEKYSVNIQEDKLIYIDWLEKPSKIPNLINHLKKFKPIIEDQKIRYEEPNWPWYALHRPRDINIFNSKEKIIVPYRSKKNKFGYSQNPIFSSRDVFFIIGKSEATLSLSYLLALLNSKLFYIWLYHRGKRKGQTLELYGTPLSEIPIKEINKEEQQPFVDKANKIISLKNDGKDTSLLENDINQMVYKLYGLTEVEIEIVENSIN